MTVAQQKEIVELKNRVAHLERMVFIGDGDRLPLAELVRNLTKTVADYIAQKDKEEQHRLDKEEQEVEQKRVEWNRWKWLIIGIASPALLTFLGQALYFYFRVLPVLEKLAQ